VEELSALGLTVQALWQLCARINPQTLTDQSITSRLTPYSSSL